MYVHFDAARFEGLDWQVRNSLMIWTAQDGGVQVCLGSVAAQKLLSLVCLDVSRSGSLTGVSLFFQATPPPLHSTRPNCLLCSSCWLSSFLFDIPRCKLLAWHVLPFLGFSSLTCQHCVKSLFGSQQCHFKMLFYVYFYGDLIDWPNAAIEPIMFSW